MRKLAKSLYLDDTEEKTSSIDTYSIFNAADSKSTGAKVGTDTKSAAMHSQSKTSSLSVGKSGAGGTSSSNRPAWALTQTAAETAVEEKELNDEEDLLSFAADLDFDRYIGDMEVRSVMDRLRQRIAEMEKEVAIEEQREGASELRADKRKQLAEMVTLFPLFPPTHPAINLSDVVIKPSACFCLHLTRLKKQCQWLL